MISGAEKLGPEDVRHYQLHMIEVGISWSLFNQAVWNALSRKGLAASRWPDSITLTSVGLAYETGLADAILHRSGH